MQKIVDQALQQNQLVIADELKIKLIRYLELIQQWNRVFNLTSILEPREMVYLHLIDSLIIAPHLHGTHFLDVGTGAGLPGIPLALLHPEQKWTLLDKNSKKTRFLTQVIADLQIKNVTVEHSRSEDFHPTHCFDTILSRAFGTLKMFVTTTEHLLCRDGQILALKGKYPEDELADIPTNFTVDNTTRLSLHGMDIERHLVCLRLKS